MNIYQTLEKIRQGLDEIGACDATVNLVDVYLTRALPLKSNMVHVSEKQVLRGLLGDKVTLDNFDVYNDFQELLTYFGKADLTEGEKLAAEDAIPDSYVDDARHPKSKKYYKEAKEAKKHSAKK